MAKLYFYYGAMGSSKTANALMTEYNYAERGQKALLGKTNIDTRDGVYKIKSRIGLEKECVLLTDICTMSNEELASYDAIIVDDLHIPVLCYGLRTDFQLNFFEGSKRLLEIADEIKEVKTVCWCGKKAICNARYNKYGIVREGSQVMLGANDEYIALCRKHFLEGKLYKDED